MQLQIDVMLKQDDEMFSVLLSPKNLSCVVVVVVIFFISISTHIHFYRSLFFWHDWMRDHRQSCVCVRAHEDEKKKTI